MTRLHFTAYRTFSGVVIMSRIVRRNEPGDFNQKFYLNLSLCKYQVFENAQNAASILIYR